MLLVMTKRNAARRLDYAASANRLAEYFKTDEYAADAAKEAEVYRKKYSEDISKTPMHISGDFSRKTFATHVQFTLAHMAVAISSRFVLAMLGRSKGGRDACIYMMEGYCLATMWQRIRTGTPINAAETAAINFCHSKGRSVGLTPDDTLEASKLATFWYSMLTSAASRDNAEAMAFMNGPTPKIAGGR
jgi:hypothetical protein